MRARSEVELVFKNELSSFETSTTEISNFTIEVLCQLPDYFLKKREDGTDNQVVAHTKSSIAFANTLFHLDYFKDMFNVTERDCIRSALFLHDGMIYGDGKNLEPVHEHPDMIATFLKHEYWDRFLPSFIRDDIIKLIACHSGQWNTSKNGLTLKKPEEPSEIFTHICIFLSSRKESTTALPLSVMYYERLSKAKKADTKEDKLDFDIAMSIAQQMVAGKQWDFCMYFEGPAAYVYLNSQKVPVAYELQNAFRTLGQSKQANPEYFTPRLLTYNDFCQTYPGWNNTVYGQPGNLYIVYGNKNISISDNQARMLGVQI